MLRLQGKVVKCFPDSVTAASCPVPAASMRRLFTCGREGGNHEDIHNGTAPRNLNGFCPDRPPRNGKRSSGDSLFLYLRHQYFLCSSGVRARKQSVLVGQTCTTHPAQRTQHCPSRTHGTGLYRSHALASSQRRTAPALSCCIKMVQNGTENEW